MPPTAVNKGGLPRHYHPESRGCKVRTCFSVEWPLVSAAVWQPGLLWTGRQGRAPVEGPVHHLAHPGKPPTRLVWPVTPPAPRLAGLGIIEHQFHLLVMHRIHRLCMHPDIGGRTKTVQGSKRIHFFFRVPPGASVIGKDLKQIPVSCVNLRRTNVASS
jgi:hypothetical protein